MKHSIFIALCMFIMFSCGNKEKEMPQNKKKSDKKEVLGKYVYEDRGHILHTKSGCKAVYKIPNVGTKPVTVIEAEMILSIDYNNICSQCVTPEQLDMLSLIIEKNKESEESADTVAIDNDED